MKRSHLLVLLPAALVASAGCGNDDSSSPAGTSGTPDAAADVSDQDATTSPDAADQDAGLDAANETSNLDSSPPDAADNDATGDDATDGTTAEAGPDRPCTLGGTECEADEKCSPEGANETLVCRPAGDKQEGGACGTSSVDDCAAGLACVPYGSTLSTCEPLCDANTACPDAAHQACFPWFGATGDVAGICLGDDCTPPSTGCANGERCTVYGSGDNTVTACAPAGPVAVGGDCSVDECIAGAMCVQSGSDYVCRAFCDGGADCTADDLHCAWPWPDVADVGLCRSGCDPVRQTGCSGGEACYYMDPDEGSTDCWTTGTLGAGADCSSFTEFCQSGYDCVLEPGSSPYEYFCRAYCDADHPCATGTCTTTGATQALKFCMP